MAYEKQEVKAGDIMDPNWGNHIQTQYEEAITTLSDSRIAERGSNANGDFIRWENGIQICFFTDSVTTATDFSSEGGLYFTNKRFTFPKPFVTIPHASPYSQRTTGLQWGAIREIGIDFIDIFNISNNHSSIGKLGYTAIGKWK